MAVDCSDIIILMVKSDRRTEVETAYSVTVAGFFSRYQDILSIRLQARLIMMMVECIQENVIIFSSAVSSILLSYLHCLAMWKE